jgi:hypothetical protein
MSKPLQTALVAFLCSVALAACGSSSSGGSSSAASSAGAGQTSTGSSSGASTGSGSSTGAGTSTGTGTTAAAGQRIGFEAVPIEQGPQLAPASSTGTSKVDGIACAPTEQLVYHIHAHLAVFDNGKLYALPAGIGIPGSQTVNTPNQGPIAEGGQCIYWLHTHAPDGVIHIESPTKRIYTLGNFFDEWRQPLTPTQVGTLQGKITAYVNGKLWKGSPRAIPLLAHQVIQFDIGEPTPPLMTVDWAKTQL